MSDIHINGERTPNLVAAGFDSVLDARSAARSVRRDGRIKARVSVVMSRDQNRSDTLAPDSVGIWKTLVRSHVVLGGLGAITGLMASVWLMAFWPAAASSPWLSMLFIGSIGLFSGLMMGGLLTLRPDHGLVADRVSEWLSEGRVAVIVHPVDEATTRRVFDALTTAGATPVRSF
jgi:hypothetical protein